MMTLRSLLPLACLAAAACDGGSGGDEHIVQRSTRLVQYQTCAALETDLESMLIEELSAQIDQIGQYGGGGAPGSPEGDDASGDGAGGGRQEGEDFSGTNNQEDGVDEADMVKTDGFHVYALNGNRLHIFGVPQFGQLSPESVTQIEGHPRQMLLHKDAKRVAVFSYIDVATLPEGHPLRELVGYSPDDQGWYWRSSTLSKITVLDISDHAAPTLVREVFYEGWYQTARRIDSTVRVAAYSLIDRRELWDYWQSYQETGEDKEATKAIVAGRIRQLGLADLIPSIYVRTPDGQFHSNSLSDAACREYYRPTDSHARGIASIISFDLFSSGISWDADHVVSNYATFYSSRNRIVLAEPAHDWWWFYRWQEDPEQLNVHAFDVTDSGNASYVGSGRVEGYVNDQFALDEENGALRIATTTGFFWRWNSETPPEPENHVWVLEQRGSELETVGHVGGIAPGERITASRFIGDKGYLVTFRQTDPLWTLDLSDNTNPRIVGELQVPGFSTYLHPLGDTNLLSIGVGGDENGANWRTTVSIFDVSNFEHPSQTASLPIAAEEGWGWSEALWEHKAFTYWAPKKLLAVPQATYNYNYDDTNGQYSYSYISRLELINVDPVTGLSSHGRIDHSPYYNAENDYYWYFTDIRRSIFMGEFVYAISDKAITAHRVGNLAKTAEAVLPGYSPDDYYWWW